MAEPPSITSILAALAAQGGQRPASASAQTQQPQQYPQPTQQAQPPYSIPAAYPLPQPISSGSVDLKYLNTIKPVSSGTVNINDAIAKAKAIAAEKGISYERPQQAYGAVDPRVANRPYMQGRSRSRSPPGRRDAFRDNYNPYRDERRSDRGPPNREYNRERSFSPVNRGRGPPGVFSPRGGYSARERSPIGRGGGDEGCETLDIDSNLVGLIIGRSGENLRRVEQETGCRVQFITNIDDTSPSRQCKISGPRVRRADAKAEINRIIEESGMGGSARPVDRRDPAAFVRDNSNTPALKAGENTVKIMVPDRTVGLIIGRGGETIRDLQERSGCHVNIVGEQKSVNGLRPVNLIGTKEASARAKDLIMEIVDSDSTKGLNKDKGPNNNQQFGARPDHGGGGGAGAGIRDSIFVPSEAVGMIIGKGGETIKEMQNTTGCKINVTPASGTGEVEREIGLVGSRDSIAQAKAAIMEKVDAVQQKNGGRGGGGGGGGAGGNRGNNDYGDRNYSQQQYGQPQGQSASATAAVPGAVGEDIYAPYGGYQGYLAMWYMMQAQQAQQQQQGGAQNPGDQPKPPGTS